MTNKPYFFLNDEPGRLTDVIAMVREIEERGFPGVFSESPGDNIALSLALLDRTEKITVGTGIAGIYLRHSHTMATGVSLIEELHPGRFLCGLGVSHVPFHEEMGVTFGKPLGDMRYYVESIREVIGAGPQPPIIVAALRRKMSALAGEIGDGVMWANAALSHLPVSLNQLPAGRRSELLLSNSAPTCVSEDCDAALAAIRRYLLFYMKLPAYQKYFIEAGYRHDVDSALRAIERHDDEAVMTSISEKLAADVGVFGTPADVRARADDWAAAGISHLVLDTVSATSTDQLQAVREVMDVFG
ncbi:LLM class F420-dependent oxidoreductase [soil metagenome]